MEDIDELIAQRDEIQKRISEIENKKYLERSKEMLGKCFKFKNCYSCPESEDDYWWLYLKCIEINSDGLPIYIGHQIDCDGMITIDRKIIRHISNSYTEITYQEYQEAFDGCLKLAKALLLEMEA